MTRRMEKVADVIQRSVAEMIERRLKDPALADTLVSITQVDVAADLSSARIHVSILPMNEGDADAAFAALKRSERFVHHELMREMRIKRVPYPRFVVDHSIEEGARLTALMRDVAQAEGRDF